MRILLATDDHTRREAWRDEDGRMWTRLRLPGEDLVAVEAVTIRSVGGRTSVVVALAERTPRLTLV